MGADVVEAVQEEVDVVVPEEARKLLSNPTDTVAFSSPRVKKMFLPPKIWFQEIPYTEKRKLRLRSQHQRDQQIQFKRLNTDHGILSDQVWPPLSLVVLTVFIW